MKKIKPEKILDWANEVLEIEIKGINALKKSLNKDFLKAIDIISQCKGRIVVTGMGKAGIVGQKFSATLSSTGSCSFWLHAAEAVHGDLGSVRDDDVVIVLSYSGETDEIKNLIPFIKKIGAKIISITSNVKSNLARYSDSVIRVKIDKEACSLGLAPTTSTTAMLAISDAIAVVLQRIKGFKEKDFAMFHPRGSLGRKLLLKVGDIMRKGRDHPVVDGDSLVRDVILKITSAHAGAAVIIDKDKKLIGIFTDGDLRRNLEIYPNILKKKIKLVMTSNPITINEDCLASEALRILEKKKIDEVPVIDNNNYSVGILDIQDLIAAGVV